MIINNNKSDTSQEEHTEKRGDDAMGNSIIGYAALDLQSLGKKNVKTVSSKEALKNVIPIDWEDDILQVRKRITITKEKR